MKFDRMNLDELRVACQGFEFDAEQATANTRAVRQEERDCWLFDCPDEDDVRRAIAAESRALSKANKCNAAINAILAGREPDPSTGTPSTAKGPQTLTIEESIEQGLAPDGSVRSTVDRPPLDRFVMGLPGFNDAFETTEAANRAIQKISDTADLVKNVALVGLALFVVSKVGG